MKYLRTLGLIIAFCLVGCVQNKMAPPPVPASIPAGQTPTALASLSGTVTDSSGAVIPGLDVYVQGHGITSHATTDNLGRYTVDLLPVGTYSVSFNRKGFSVKTVSEVAVRASEAASLDVTMDVGTASKKKKSTVSHHEAQKPPADTEWAGIASFPTHPPKASTRSVLPTLVMPNGQPTKTLGDIDTVLSKALSDFGYGTKGYYPYPDGFALATRMEQIFPDGRSMPIPARFSGSPPVPKSFGLNYFTDLFVPRRGYFRVIVFIVTDLPIAESDSAISEKVASGWPDAGGDALPPVAVHALQPDSVKVTAFVYEFRNSTADSLSQFTLLNQTTIAPNEVLLDTKQHLQGAGLWAALGLP